MELQPYDPDQSPFDAIRHVDEQGEYWLARELQPLMQYGRWAEFAAVVDKAKASLALVEGKPQAEHHFVGCHSDGGRWGNQPLDDVRLTRFGAYLTAMAGDDTKEAVAYARVYFAVKTREAEVSQELNELQVARKYVAALEAKEALAAENKALKPKAELADQFLTSDGTVYLNDIAKNLGTTRPKLIDVLRARGVLYKRELNFMHGYESWFRVTQEWHTAKREWVRALKVTRVGVQGIFALFSTLEIEGDAA